MKSLKYILLSMLALSISNKSFGMLRNLPNKTIMLSSHYSEPYEPKFDEEYNNIYTTHTSNSVYQDTPSDLESEDDEDEPVIIAAKNNDFNLVKNIIEETRIIYNHLNLTGYNLSIALYVNKTDPISNKSALHYAAKYGNMPMIKYLMDLGATIDTSISYYDDNRICYEQNPLHLASKYNQYQAVKYILKTIHAKQIIFSASHNDITIPNLDFNMYEAEDKIRSQINAQCYCSCKTALHFAASAENDAHQIVKKLLHYNADASIKDFNEDTPLHLASQKGNINVVKVLVNHNPKLMLLKNKSGRTPLHEAVKNNHLAIVHYLLSKNSNPNIKDINGNTPLHWAALTNNIPMIELLIQHKAQLEIVNDAQETPADLTTECDALCLCLNLFNDLD